MKKFFIFLLVFAVFFLFGCGNKKSDEKESVKNDTDSEIFDEEKNDKPDNDPENGEILEPDDDPENGETLEPDDDPENSEYPDSSCCDCNQQAHYYGSVSSDSDENFFDQCVQEAANSPHCYMGYPEFDAKELFENLRKVTLIFKKECRQQPFGPVLCPDFIPDSISLSGAQLTGCIIDDYEYGEYYCNWHCPYFYFSIDDERFKTVSFSQDFYFSGYPFYYEGSFGIKDSETGESFHAVHTDYCDKTWCGAVLDSWTEGQRYPTSFPFKIVIDGVPEEEDVERPGRQCEDSEGKIYNDGERRSSKCKQFYCEDGKWYEDDILCQDSTCHNGTKAKWLCNDNKTEVDWCDCVGEEGAFFGLWKCKSRADLYCPE